MVILSAKTWIAKVNDIFQNLFNIIKIFAIRFQLDFRFNFDIKFIIF